MPPRNKTQTSARVRARVLDEDVFTTEDIARDLDLSVRTILRAIASKKLKAKMTGRQYHITRSAVREWYDNLPTEVKRKPRKVAAEEASDADA